MWKKLFTVALLTKSRRATIMYSTKSRRKAMKKIYRLTPATKNNVWGGNRLREYGKVSEDDRIAESWELSFTKGGEARIEDGRTLCEAFGPDAWGSACRDFEFFPVLTKFIDAKDKLSVQVHPSDEYALQNEGQYGKTEMWYVVDAEPGAGIYIGLREKCEPDSFRKKVEDGTVEELLAFTPVKAGDVFFIPSGTIHAILDGVLIYEIQQNSTLTYRLYDYLRRDQSGNLRELHVDKAMKVSSLDVYSYPRVEKNDVVIGKCNYFTAEKYKLKFTKKWFDVTDESYLAFTCIAGGGRINGESISRGDSFFVPAGSGRIEVETDGEIELITVKTEGNAG